MQQLGGRASPVCGAFVAPPLIQGVQSYARAPPTAPRASGRPRVLPITHLEDHVAGVLLQEVDADDPNQGVLLILLVQGVCTGIASPVTSPFRRGRNLGKDPHPSLAPLNAR